MEEHQEALRREQLAQELAEAEQADLMLQGEEAGIEEDMEERDLDDDVPEAEVTGMDAGDDDEDEDEDNEVDSVLGGEEAVLERRMPDDVYREAIARGDEVRRRLVDVEGLSDEEGDQSQMLQEDDLIHGYPHEQQDIDMGMDMDADLDDEVPEADEGAYEHTDTEAELSSSDEDESVDVHHLPQVGRQPPSSMVRSDGTQNSLDLSALDLRGSSSFAGSSPGTRGFPSSGRARRGRNI